MMLYKQSVAPTIIVGPILDSAGAEYASAIIGDLSISKNGGTLTPLASGASLSYESNGQYTLALRTTDVDTLGRAQITCNKNTYQMPTVGLMVVPATVFDAIITNAANTTGGMLIGTGAITGLVGTIANTTNITQAAGILLASSGLDSVTSWTVDITGDITGNIIGSVDSVQTTVDANTVQWLGSPCPTPSVSGVPEVDVTYINGEVAVGSGVPNVNVSTMASGTITANVLASDAVAEIWAASTAPTASGIADVVWDELLVGHTGVGSAGAVLYATSGSSDPWTVSLPGSYTGSQAGKMLSDVLVDTAEIGTAGAGLTNINLPNQTMDIIGNITGNISGSIGSIATSGITAASIATDAITEIQTGLATPTNITAGTITTVTNLTNAPASGDLTATMKASINAEVVDVLSTDTYAELGAIPAATSSLKDKLTWVFMFFRNKLEQTATTKVLKADDGTTTVATFTESDNGTTYTSGEGS